MKNKYNQNEKKETNDELIKEIDKMILEGKSKEKIDEKIERLEVLLEDYVEK